MLAVPKTGQESIALLGPDSGFLESAAIAMMTITINTVLVIMVQWNQDRRAVDGAHQALRAPRRLAM
jgi:hypothetical protein